MDSSVTPFLAIHDDNGVLPDSYEPRSTTSYAIARLGWFGIDVDVHGHGHAGYGFVRGLSFLYICYSCN